MRILLARHGETPWNAEGRYQGQIDIPLSPIGESQAQALGQRLQDLPITRAVASPGAMLPGDVSAHDGWMVHRAGANQMPRPREAYALHYFADGARIIEPDTVARRRILEAFGPGLAPGDLAASRRWRLVYPECEPFTPV